MSRSGYNDGDGDNWSFIKWRGVVASASRGKRGQKLLRDLRAALLALPEKKLIAEALETEDGSVCALGAVGKLRGIDMAELDPEDYDTVASTFDIAAPLAQEIVWLNDESVWSKELPEARYERMLRWVESQIKPETV